MGKTMRKETSSSTPRTRRSIPGWRRGSVSSSEERQGGGARTADISRSVICTSADISHSDISMEDNSYSDISQGDISHIDISYSDISVADISSQQISPTQFCRYPLFRCVDYQTKNSLPI